MTAQLIYARVHYSRSKLSHGVVVGGSKYSRFRASMLMTVASFSLVYLMVQFSTKSCAFSN